MKALLRPAVAGDVEILSAILPSLLPGEWSPARLHELLQSRHCLRVMCTDAQAGILGFAEFMPIADEADLLGIAIVPAHQGEGLGGKLLDGILTELRQAGCRRCLLEVRRSNAKAVRLYESRRFALDGVRKDYYPPLVKGGGREDALLYSLPLD